MRSLVKLRIAVVLSLLAAGTAPALAQQLNSTGLYKHGTNSHSAGATVVYEATDSVTVGAATDYYVMPDALYNPSFAAATSLSDGIVSTFTWTPDVSGPNIVTKSGYKTNYVTITWPASTGLFRINVKENGGTCGDPTGQNIDVRVINKPTANFSSATTTECTPTPASHTFTLPLALSTDMNHNNLIVDFTVVYTPVTGSPSTNNYTGKILSETGSLTLEALKGSALAYGKYEITITSVRDRISVKSNVDGVIGAIPKYTYNLIRLPQTGAIYHIPNN